MKTKMGTRFRIALTVTPPPNRGRDGGVANQAIAALRNFKSVTLTIQAR